MQKPLDLHAGPLYGLTVKMTGLDPSKDKILEIAVSQTWNISYQSMDD